MATGKAVQALLQHYPRIYFACHARHVRDPSSGELVSDRQVSILDHLDEVEATGLTRLADHMGVTASTMSLSIDRLERRGYVRRERHPEDGRRVQLRLTQEGVGLREARSVLEPDRVGKLLDQLSPTELADALQGLALLATAADRLRFAHAAGV